MVSEVLVQDWLLAPSLWVSGEAELYGVRIMWQRKLLTSWQLGNREKQRENGPVPFEGMPP
jgi:hypothetical protein